MFTLAETNYNNNVNFVLTCRTGHSHVHGVITASDSRGITVSTLCELCVC